VITAPIAPGIIDVHAHWLPPHLFGLPPGAPYGAMYDRGGQLYLGDLPRLRTVCGPDKLSKLPWSTRYRI
jgi:hypothetical protein